MYILCTRTRKKIHSILDTEYTATVTRICYLRSAREREREREKERDTKRERERAVELPGTPVIVHITKIRLSLLRERERERRKEGRT